MTGEPAPLGALLRHYRTVAALSQRALAWVLATLHYPMSCAPSAGSGSMGARQTRFSLKAQGMAISREALPVLMSRVGATRG
jgi:hypothetical protein